MTRPGLQPYDILEKAKLRRPVVARSSGWGERNRWSKQDFQGSGSTPYGGYVSWCICPDPQNVQHLVNCDINCELWVTGMGQCKFIVTNGPLWWGVLILVGAVHGWGQGAYWELLYLPLNVAVNLKLLKK